MVSAVAPRGRGFSRRPPGSSHKDVHVGGLKEQRLGRLLTLDERLLPVLGTSEKMEGWWEGSLTCDSCLSVVNGIIIPPKTLVCRKTPTSCLCVCTHPLWCSFRVRMESVCCEKH